VVDNQVSGVVSQSPLDCFAIPISVFVQHAFIEDGVAVPTTVQVPPP
jgi:hypothetical protein